MNVLPLYIDDWLSSQSIDDMDAEEERGYFRLCLHAAKLELEGLPNDERLLANWSRLGPQWSKPSRDKRFRSGVTSGQKILQNFQEKDGRLFNERVLKCVEQYKARQDQAQQAAQKRWSGRDAPAMQTHMPEHCGRNATRVGSENRQESSHSTGGSVEGDTTEAQSWDGKACGWEQVIEAAAHARMSFDPSPDSTACGQWTRLSIENKYAAIHGIYARTKCGQYDDPAYVPTLDNYVRCKKWRESLRPRARTRSPDRKTMARQEAMRRIQEDLEDARRRKVHIA